jgi:hypothetical protein
MTLCLTSLVAGIAEAVTPQGSTRKYVRVALGMIIVSLVLQPVVDIVQRVRGGVEPALQPLGAAAPAFSSDRGETLAARVKWQVETMAMSIEGVKAATSAVTVATEGGMASVRRLEVRLLLDAGKAHRGSAIAEALRALLSAYLNMRPEDVRVSIAG